MALESINPATGESIRTYEEHSADEVDRMLSAAVAAFDVQRSRSFSDRGAMLHALADALQKRASDLAAIMTREMGKPITQATAEAEKCAWGCRYYADNGERFLSDEMVETDGARTYVAYQPLGPILAVMPWNFPFWQVFRFAAPAMMAGNVALLKHASNVTGCALAIEDLFQDAGFGDAFQTLKVGSDRVGEIIEDSRIRAATLTGSVGAGKSVGASAGKFVKPSVLELGGSDPFIVLSDADLDKAAEIGVKARMQNNAQSCIAAKRFIVEAPVFDAFKQRYVDRVEALQVGDPMEESTEIGPLARKDVREDIHDQVQRSLDDGATLLTGGKPLDGEGYFYAPTVLGDVEAGTVAFQEEIFGPVASLIRARDLDHAVELANDTRFGLGGSVFTEDREKGEQVARRLEVGCAFVNEMVKSDPRLPFGGVKESGYGRELSHFGIREFVNIKTVWVA